MNFKHLLFIYKIIAVTFFLLLQGLISFYFSAPHKYWSWPNLIIFFAGGIIVALGIKLFFEIDKVNLIQKIKVPINKFSFEVYLLKLRYVALTAIAAVIVSFLGIGIELGSIFFLITDADKLESKANKLARDGHLADSIKVFESLVSISDRADYLNNYAWTLLKIKNNELAYQVAKKAYQKNNEDLYVVDTYACALYAVGDVKASLKLAKKYFLQKRVEAFSNNNSCFDKVAEEVRNISSAPDKN